MLDLLRRGQALSECARCLRELNPDFRLVRERNRCLVLVVGQAAIAQILLGGAPLRFGAETDT